MMGTEKHNVLIEASKMLTPHKDGVKRYVFYLLQGLLAIAKEKDSPWEFYVYLAAQGNKGIRNILDIEKIINEDDLFKTMHRKMSSIFGPGYLPKRLYAKLKNRIQGANREFFESKLRHYDIPEFDIIHLTAPQLYQPILNEAFVNNNSKFITTVHDLTHIHYPQFHRERNIEVSKSGLAAAVKLASVFMAVSTSTANDLLTAFPSIHSTDVYVVYPAFDPSTFARVADKHQITDVMKKYKIPQKPFLLSLSTLEPRKNISNMIKAFLSLKTEVPEMDINFVVAGGKGWKYRELFNDKSLKSDNVIFTGFIEERDLSVLYSAAMALSYVSFYEGFGIPLLEAMGCGTPVIYGNNSSMPEVAGDAGLSADPMNITDIKEAFRQIVMNRDLRERLSVKALANSRKFSLDMFINDTIRVYENVLSNKDHLRKR